MTDSKFIKIPPPITPIMGGPLYTLKDAVTHVIDNEPRFQSPASNARRGMRILAAFDARSDGVAEIHGVLELRADDHKFLNDVFENPSCGYALWTLTDRLTGTVTEKKVATRQYMPFIDAIDQATNGDPRKTAASVLPEAVTNGAAAQAS
jgi:hypothetical protein